MGKLAKFKSRIRRTFNDSIYPGDDHIAKNIEHYEINDLQETFQKKDWRDVSVEVSEAWRMSTMLFTPKAFRYFLPAFLLGAVHKNAIEISSYLIYALIPPNEPTELAQFIEMMNGFTDAQRSVIGEWIKRFFDNNPIDDQHHGEVTKAFWNITD